ncbi:MAG: Asp-tRNA(Asn)/Glu-tRNA(Gln) amidotransferase subunit GatA [Burkholderiaceae bacterium]|nr:Asp-tRNA(Asn)/Glu-tRNA(Gln) amidotransferase subunit GatA [Burkholderiaceae bacterium]
MATELFHSSVVELSNKLAKKEVSAVELAQMYLDRIDANKDLNAFLDVRPEVTLAQARAADEKIAAGQAGRLTGVPIAHKDIFVTNQWASTAASKMLDGYMSPFDATVVKNLDNAGMVCLGKLNCDEFAMGGSNENSAYGRVLNPWDKSSVPGGSSGGSAAAVAASLAPIATGTDTGGSIRQPAAFTGITGLKPTYGRPSRWGMIAFASSLDTAGLMARSAEDCAFVFNDMIEFDPKDSTCVNLPKEDFTRSLNAGVKGKKIGVPRAWFAQGLDPELAASIEEVIKTYERMGAQIVDIELPTVNMGVPVYYVVACAEASSNLSRFDGVRYGHRAKSYTDIQDMMRKSRSEGFGAEPQRRIMIGTYVLSHGYYDAYYIQAQRVRRLIANEFNSVFQSVDAIISPVATGTAYNFGEKSDPVSAYLSDLYTVPVSLAGLPGMGIPCGVHSNGRPMGFQLICPSFHEADLLGMAHTYQLETDWHKLVPTGY